jgi:hypothetical protein
MTILIEAKLVIERFRNIFETPLIKEQVGYNAVDAALEYVDHHECGVALDLICSQLLDHQINISRDDYMAVQQFVNTYMLPPKRDIDLIDLDELEKLVN